MFQGYVPMNQPDLVMRAEDVKGRMSATLKGASPSVSGSTAKVSVVGASPDPTIHKPVRPNHPGLKRKTSDFILVRNEKLLIRPRFIIWPGLSCGSSCLP